MKNKGAVRTITQIAVMAALIFSATFFIRMPVPVLSNLGYVNAGDAAIYLCAAVLPGIGSILAAVIGSSLADLLAGAAIYILPTALIKGLLAFIFSQFYKEGSWRSALALSIGCGLVMCAGYALFELLFFDMQYALLALPFNFAQLLLGTILCMLTHGFAGRIRNAIGAQK